MVQLRLTVKIPPPELAPQASRTDGKVAAPTKSTNFLIVLPTPDQVTLGKLCWLISEKWTKLRPNAEPIAIKKLLDDSQPDLELDIDLTVADVFIDHGKAQADGHDQRAVVRVLQMPLEHDRPRVRYGSIVQDWAAAVTQHSPPNEKRSHPAGHDHEEKLSAIPEASEYEETAVVFSDEEDEGYLGRAGRNPREMSVELGGDWTPKKHYKPLPVEIADTPAQKRDGGDKQVVKRGKETTDKYPHRSERHFGTAAVGASKEKYASRGDSISQDNKGSTRQREISSIPASSSHPGKRRWSNTGWDDAVIVDSDAGPGPTNTAPAKRQKTATRTTTSKAINTTKSTPIRKATGEQPRDEKVSPSGVKTYGGMTPKQVGKMPVYDLTKTDDDEKPRKVGGINAIANGRQALTDRTKSFQKAQRDDDDDVMEVDSPAVQGKKDNNAGAKTPKDSFIKRSRVDSEQDPMQIDIEELESDRDVPHHNAESKFGSNAKPTPIKQETKNIANELPNKKLTHPSPHRESSRRKSSGKQHDDQGASRQKSDPNDHDEELKTTVSNTNKMSETELKPAEKYKDTKPAKTASGSSPVGPRPGQMGLGIPGSPHKAKMRAQAVEEAGAPLKAKKESTSQRPAPRDTSFNSPSVVVASEPDPSGTNDMDKTPASESAVVAQNSAATAKTLSVEKKSTAKKPSSRANNNSKPFVIQLLEEGKDPDEYIASGKFPPHVNKEWVDTYRTEYKLMKEIEAAKEERKSSREINLLESILSKTQTVNISKRTGEPFKAKRAIGDLRKAELRLKEYRKSLKTDANGKEPSSQERRTDIGTPKQPLNLRQSTLTGSPVSNGNNSKGNKKEPTPMVCVPILSKTQLGAYNVMNPSALPKRSARNNSANCAKATAPQKNDKGTIVAQEQPAENTTNAASSSSTDSSSESDSNSELKPKQTPTPAAKGIINGTKNYATPSQKSKLSSAEKVKQTTDSLFPHPEALRNTANNHLVDTEPEVSDDDYSTDSSDSDDESKEGIDTKPAKVAKGKSTLPPHARTASDAAYVDEDTADPDTKSRRGVLKKTPSPTDMKNQAKSVAAQKGGSASADRVTVGTSRRGSSQSRPRVSSKELNSLACLNSLSQPEPRNVASQSSSARGGDTNGGSGNETGRASQGQVDTLKSMKAKQWPGLKMFSMFSKGDKEKDGGGK